MQLTVPQRTIADATSFPVDPDEVNHWLANLEPSQSTNDAMEVYRGLRHSNRLHNEINRRRGVLACFIPSLRELNSSLREITQPQPLPLTTEFQRSAQLLDGLLREEAFAFKILLADSPQPRGDDIRRAMQALARQAESRIFGFRAIPETLLQDAHQLYRLAEEFSLQDAVPDEEARSAADHYKHILLLTIADCRQHRVRQLIPLIHFLRSNSSSVRIRKNKPNEPGKLGNFAVHLEHGARPVQATALLTNTDDNVRWFSIVPVLTRIDTQLAKSKSEEAAVLGSETLDRQSLARLRVTLARDRKRRAQRGILHEPHRVIVGHKAICAHLHLQAAKAASLEAENAEDNFANAYEAMDHASEIMDTEDEPGWMVVNQSPHGAALFQANCRPGTVQVGELVSIESEQEVGRVGASGKSSAKLGVVRWLKATDGSAVKFGVEFLAKGVLPVGISRTHSDDVVADDGLIIACKVKDAVLQTILLPAYLYQVGDRMTVELNGKSRNVKLQQALQSNGLFSHFSLMDV